MARSRNIKPGFFVDDELVELPALTRLLFIGLWCLADREGRLEDRPKKIKLEILPGDDIDVDAALQSLTPAFLTRYQVDGKKYIQINNFLKHQKPHVKESASTILPPHNENQTSTGQEQAEPLPRELQAPALVSASTDQESLIPDSLLLIPDCNIKPFAGAVAPAPLTVLKAKPKPDPRHGWFLRWFVWASEEITGAPYLVTKKDAGIVKTLLALGIDELFDRSCYYLLLPDEQRYPRGSPTLPGLAFMTNQIAGKDTSSTIATARQRGIHPPDDIPLNLFTPWKEP